MAIGLALAGASVISSFLAARSANAASRRQQEVAFLNLEEQRRSRADNKTQAELVRRQSLAPRVGPGGDRTSFDPVSGFSTQLTPGQEQVQSGSIATILAQIQEALESFRREAGPNRDRRIEAGGAADAALQRLGQVRTPDAGYLNDLLNAQGAAASGEATRRAIQPILRQLGRSGNSAAGAGVLEKIISGQAANRRDTASRNALTSLQAPTQIANAERNSALNQFISLGNFAGQGRGQQVQDSITPLLASLQGSQASSGLYGAQIAASLGKSTPAQLNPNAFGPNYTAALLTQGLGNNLQQLLQNKEFQKFFASSNSAPTTSLGNTGTTSFGSDPSRTFEFGGF